MAKRQHIDDILRQWAYDPNAVTVRLVPGKDGREIIQMRVDMGILQLETSGRPDGTTPEGFDTYFEYIRAQALEFGDDEDNGFELDEDQCVEIDREFVQFYHRRICWLALRQYEQAVADADHTLGLMDFCRDHSPDEQWTMSHEQYRPFVLFHRTQAAALARLEEVEDDSDGAEAAVHEINQGLDHLRNVFVQYGVEEHFDDDDLVSRLVDLREDVRKRHEVGRTLHEQLADAVAAEQYEQAARIRDELAKRKL